MFRLLTGFILLITLSGACDNGTTFGNQARPFEQWKGLGCELINEEDLIQVLGVRPYEDVLNSRALPNEVFCLRTWKKPDWMQRENNNEKKDAVYLSPHNRLVVNVIHYGDETQSAERFAIMRRDRRDTYEEDVPGLGDDALWSTSTVTLLVKKGPMLLQIALEHTDTPHDNLIKAKELAAIALKRI